MGWQKYCLLAHGSEKKVKVLSRSNFLIQQRKKGYIVKGCYRPKWWSRVLLLSAEAGAISGAGALWTYL